MTNSRMQQNVHLVLGGARSGKSRYAESLAKNTTLPVIYMATANALDHEMQSRILRHQMERQSDWVTLEVGENLASALTNVGEVPHCIIIDCLTLWVTRLLCEHASTRQQLDDLLARLQATHHTIIIVSNETGMGVVPLGELTRQFVDTTGFLHQAIAAMATQVTLMVAGIPLTVKDDRP